MKKILQEIYIILHFSTETHHTSLTIYKLLMKTFLGGRHGQSAA